MIILRLFRLTLLVLCLSFSVLSVSSANEAARKDQLLDQLFEATNLKANMITVMQTAITGGYEKLLRQDSRIPKDRVPELLEIIRQTFADETDRLIDPMKQLYAQEFTVEELEVMIEYQTSPVGQKAARLMPKLTQQGMMLGQHWGEQVGVEAYKKVREILRKDGINI